MYFKTILVTSTLTLAAVAAGCSSSSTSSPASDDADAEAPAPTPSSTANADAGNPADSGPAPTSGATSPAIAAFWTAIHAGDWASSADVITQLKAEAAANPKDAVRAEYVGVAEVWRAAESGRDPANAASIGMSSGQAAGQDLGGAHTLDPSNFFTSGFLGISTVDYGVLTSSAAIENQGFGYITQAGMTSRQFGDFTAAFATHLLPPSDPKVTAGLASLWDLFDTCIGGTLDRKNPDYTPYFARAFAPDAKRFCWNSTEAPHGLEGALLFMGDFLVKTGDVDTAKIFYQNAQKSPGYATWLHAPAVESRLASDLTARSQAFTGADPNQWPSVGDAAYSCTQCHGATAL